MKDESRFILHPFLTAAILITLLAFAIRLNHLGGDSFWIDEMATVRTAQSLQSALAGERDHPPLIYLATYLSIAALGQSEISARLPAFLFSVAAIPAIAVLGRTLGTRRVGLWAALLLALASFHLKYAQEARHYSALVFFSLCSHIFLLRALKSDSRRAWFLFSLFTVLNLYTHFAAFLVLGGQVVFILGLLTVRRLSGTSIRWQNPLTAGLIVVLLFLPWLTRLRAALPYNVGAHTITDTGTATGLSEWVRGLWYAFTGGGALGLILTSLAIVAVLLLAQRRAYFELGFFGAALLVPLVLIPLLEIARGPFPRYLIFILPVALLLSAYAVAAATDLLQQRVGKGAEIAFTFAGALSLLVLSMPGIRHEYQFMVADWRGMAQAIAGQGSPVLALNLNFASGYNIVADSLPYYLAVGEQAVYAGNGLRTTDAQALAQATSLVLAVHDWKPANPFGSDLNDVEVYQTGLYTRAVEGAALPAAIAEYERLVHAADAPAPQCLLRQDLALLYAVAGRSREAAETFSESLVQCPQLPPAVARSAREAVRQEIATGLVQELASTRLPRAEADAAAEALWELAPDYLVTSDQFTAVDLIELYRAGAAAIVQESAVEPIRPMQFALPGAFSEPVIMMHPPAELRFNVRLPEAPLHLVARFALAPESWPWGGDGATYVIGLQDATGRRHELYRQHIGNEPGDHVWHDLSLPLSDYSGQAVTLLFSTEPGPTGDFTGDWAGWSRLRILTLSATGGEQGE